MINMSFLSLFKVELIEYNFNLTNTYYLTTNFGVYQSSIKRLENDKESGINLFDQVYQASDVCYSLQYGMDVSFCCQNLCFQNQFKYKPSIFCSKLTGKTTDLNEHCFCHLDLGDQLVFCLSHEQGVKIVHVRSNFDIIQEHILKIRGINFSKLIHVPQVRNSVSFILYSEQQLILNVRLGDKKMEVDKILLNSQAQTHQIPPIAGRLNGCYLEKQSLFVPTSSYLLKMLFEATETSFVVKQVTQFFQGIGGVLGVAFLGDFAVLAVGENGDENMECEVVLRRLKDENRIDTQKVVQL